jgi:hypothetical protein
MTYVQQLVGGETEKAEVIQLICDTMENQIEKIKRCMQQEDRTTIEKAMLYLDDASDYLRRQKRKYTIGRHTTSIPDTPPIKYLKSQQSNLTMYNDFIELDDYVKRFRNKNSGRVNWKQCFKQGHEEKKAVIMQFSTSEVSDLNTINAPIPSPSVLCPSPLPVPCPLPLLVLYPPPTLAKFLKSGYL